jgi:2-desacetyl-2-hydroxyethyl bacteriochlorophyllide A dehydrogenase
MTDRHGMSMEADAVWFVAPRQAKLRHEPVAEPAPNELTVRSVCSMVSAGSELHMYRGEGNLPPTMPIFEGTLPFPVKFGYQQVGVVELAGAETGFRRGERVLCMFPHQSIFTLTADRVRRVPDAVTDVGAAFSSLFTVAINSLLTRPAMVGEHVAVSGLGAIGMFTAHLARPAASKLILVEPSAARRAAAEWIGADAVADPCEAGDAISALTGGQGVDLFIECSGAGAALQVALDSTAMEGTITVTGWYGADEVSLRLSPAFHLRRHRVLSSGPFLPSDLGPRWTLARQQDVAFERIAKLDLDEIFDIARMPFRQAAQGYAMLDGANPPAAVLFEY